MFAPVYLDHNATTPLDERVLEAMLPYLREQYGNASSRHEYGRATRRAIDEARQRVAFALGAHPTEVVFTSSGSEANNLFLKGAAACRKPGVIAISAIEHPCVGESARQLVKAGWRLRELPVDARCRVASADLRTPLSVDVPSVLSVMMVNNETGVLQDLLPVLSAVKGADSWCHSDAVQAFGKVPVNFRQLNAAGLHALSVSAHKIGGPKGAGALVVDKRLDLAPLIAGGGQERGLRSGTENVAAIVGFGVAAERAVANLDVFSRQMGALHAVLESGLSALGATIFGLGAQRLPNTSYFAFAGVDGETLVGKLDRAGFAVASGAACSSANPDVSRVLQAMTVAPELARGAVRVSLGIRNTAQQIEDFLAALRATLGELKALRAVSA